MQFQVWNEGYSATWQSAPAICHGTYEAETFAAAVEKAIVSKDLDRRLIRRNTAGEPEAYWGCRFFGIMELYR